MGIAVPFFIDFPYNDKVQEFNIQYNHFEDDYIDLVKFIETYPAHRINIELVVGNIDLEKIINLSKINNNVYFKLNKDFINKIEDFIRFNIKFFFDTIVNNWDHLNSYLNIGVSDIYISGELCFNLNIIKEKLKEKNIHSRVILNIAQIHDDFDSLDPIKSFFIRPEDLKFYSSFINTFEFFIENKEQLTILYESYVKDKYWYGDLSEIILGLNKEIDSRTLLPNFAEYRANCGKKCFKDSNCTICERIYILSNKLLDKNLIISIKQDLEEEDGS